MNNEKKVVVLVSGGGTNLQALIDAEKAGKLGSGKITCVIASKPGVYALERAVNSGIKTRVLERRAYSDSAEYSEAMKNALCEEGADVIVYAGFMTILDEKVCAPFKYKMLNVHPSLIPSFCGKGYYGLKVHEEALKKGVKVTGATVHFVTEECDGGPIVLQKAVEVKQDDTPETLQRRVMEEAEWKILPEAVRLLCDGKLEVDGGKVIIK